jgi:hypothetical protein
MKERVYLVEIVCIIVVSKKYRLRLINRYSFFLLIGVVSILNFLLAYHVLWIFRVGLASARR